MCEIKLDSLSLMVFLPVYCDWLFGGTGCLVFPGVTKEAVCSGLCITTIPVACNFRSPLPK